MAKFGARSILKHLKIGERAADRGAVDGNKPPPNDRNRSAIRIIDAGKVVLKFNTAVAEIIIQKIPPQSRIRLVSVGSLADQVIADNYHAFFQQRGLQVERIRVEKRGTPENCKICIVTDGIGKQIIIAPSAS